VKIAQRENLPNLKWVDNIDFVRLSCRRIDGGTVGKKTFRRLKDVDLDSFNFSTVLVDPSESGLDMDSIELVSNV